MCKGSAILTQGGAAGNSRKKKIRDRGLARAVGVSNFSAAHIAEMKRAGLQLPELV